jgi:hypothetical protein
MNFLRTSYARVSRVKIMPESGSARLNGPHACILSDILVLVQPIFGRFAFFQIDGKFDKKEHNRLK